MPPKRSSTKSKVAEPSPTKRAKRTTTIQINEQPSKSVRRKRTAIETPKRATGRRKAKVATHSTEQQISAETSRASNTSGETHPLRNVQPTTEVIPNNGASILAPIESVTRSTLQGEPIIETPAETANSNEIPSVSSTLSRNNILNCNTSENPLLLISAALSETLRTVREVARKESDVRSGGRYNLSKCLPEFSGNPLDWIHFLESYRTSTDSGGFSDRENIGRLHAALRGKARDAVRTLFATATSAEKIINTLELNFGNKHVVAGKLIQDIRDMPKLATRELNLVQFADRLHNNVMALESMNMKGYLQDRDLLINVANKLPEAVKFAYYRHNSELPEDASMLEKLIEFLRHEAQLAKNKGLFDLDVGQFERRRDGREYDAQKRRRREEVHVISNSRDGSNRARAKETKNKCIHCGSNHEIVECRIFEKESSRKRWKLAKKRGLCYVCLRKWKPQHVCEKKSVCDYCNGNHHNLLHFFDGDRHEADKSASPEAENSRCVSPRAEKRPAL